MTKGLGDQNVKAYDATAHGLRLGRAALHQGSDDAYAVTFADGQGETAVVEEVLVYPANTDDADILAQLKPLIGLAAVAARMEPVKGVLRQYGSKGLGNSRTPAQSVVDLLNRKFAGAPDDVDALVTHVVHQARRLLGAHPFKEANGRTALYLIYDVLLNHGYELQLSALDLHGLTLTEDMPVIDEHPEVVVGKLVPNVTKVGPGFDAQHSRDVVLNQLDTLEADREVRLKQRLKEVQEAALQERPEYVSAGASDYAKWKADRPEEVRKALVVLESAEFIYPEHSVMTIAVDRFVTLHENWTVTKGDDEDEDEEPEAVDGDELFADLAEALQDSETTVEAFVGMVKNLDEEDIA